MRLALITNYLPPYRLPLYERLAKRHQLEVLCYGGDARYLPPWFSGLEEQLANAAFPARLISGTRDALGAGRGVDVVIAPFAGGEMLPAAYVGARRGGAAFILWASVWAQPRTAMHLLTLPAIRHIYRHANAVIAYGEHVKRFVASMRRREDDVFVAPQAVESDHFAREVADSEVESFRSRYSLPPGALVLYVGRAAVEKGIETLSSAWRRMSEEATLVVVGDGPLQHQMKVLPRTRVLGSLPRQELPIAYAAAELSVMPSIRTSRFLEPWGLVCNESLHQGRPVVATSCVGAVAGGLVRHEQTGLVVPPQDSAALATAIERLLADPPLRAALGSRGREAVGAYTYSAMADAFERALEAAMTNHAPEPPGN